MSRSIRMAGLALVALLLAGCGVLGTSLDMSDRLRRDGFRDVTVNLDSTNGHDVVEIRFSGHRTLGSSAARDRAAELVWDELPLRVDEIEVTTGGYRTPIDRRELEAAFGPRNPALDQRRIGREIAGGFATVGIVVLVGVVVGMGLLLWLVVWLVRRDQRRRPLPVPFRPVPPPGPYPPGPYPPGPYPPGPPPAGLFGPPPN